MPCQERGSTELPRRTVDSHFHLDHTARLGTTIALVFALRKGGKYSQAAAAFRLSCDATSCKRVFVLRPSAAHLPSSALFRPHRTVKGECSHEGKDGEDGNVHRRRMGRG